MSGVKINTLLLVWARERAGMSQEQLAKKVGKANKPEIIRAWENGEAQPTFRQVQTIAQALKVPMGYLFLSDTPVTSLPVADFRTIPDNESGKYSIDLEEVLNDALRKRDWMREWRIKEGFSQLGFVGRFSLNDNLNDVVNNIRETLDLPYPTKMKYGSWDDHLRVFVHHAEDAGIIVLRSGIVGNNTHRKLSINEFRGFNLADDIAPLIFINTADTITGRIFTLAHELCHLWTGTTGISNPSLDISASSSIKQIERFCNQVAAELLVPADALVQYWNPDFNSIEVVQNLAKIFRVSAFVILIKAHQTELINDELFKQTYTILKREVKEQYRQSGGSGDYYNNLRVRNGRLLMTDVVDALKSGSLLYQEAAGLLNVKIKSLDNVIQNING